MTIHDITIAVYNKRWKERLHKMYIKASHGWDYYYDWGLEDWVFVEDDSDMGWTLEMLFDKNITPINRAKGEQKRFLSGKDWKKSQPRHLPLKVRTMVI